MDNYYILLSECVCLKTLEIIFFLSNYILENKDKLFVKMIAHVNISYTIIKLIEKDVLVAGVRYVAGLVLS